MAKIVIIGAGVGGIPMAYEVREELGKEHEITLVSNTPEFHFVPSNPWVAVDWRKPEDIKVPLAPYMKKKKVNFTDVGCEKILPDDNKVILGDGSELDYDYLVIATGPRLAFDEIEGLGPEGYTQSICHVDHAEQARDKWLEFCEKPGPVVVGAAAGASCFGPAYEFAFIMDRDLRKRKIRDQVPITYITPEPYIGHMGLEGVGDSKTLLEGEFRERHINWITNAKITRVEDGMMHVSECDNDGNEIKTHEVPFDYSMILPPFSGVDPVRNIEAEGILNPKGFVIVDKHQRNPAYPNIYSVGVCVAIAPKNPTPVPTGVPKTGYMIESMVAATVKNIHSDINGEAPTAEASWNAICLADMGDTGIAFVAIPQIPPRNVTWARKGKWVHLAKIAFEKYFMRKVKTGSTDPYYENLALKTLGIKKFK